MNIMLKSFDGEYCKEFVGRALQDIELDTLVWVGNDTKQMPDVSARTTVFIPADPCRKCRFPDVDWNTVAPIDKPLIEAMRDCEAVFMQLAIKYLGFEAHYSLLKDRYLKTLRYWNDFLEKHPVDLLISNHTPHQAYDIVLYDLCRLKGIKTLIVHRNNILDGFFIDEDWEETNTELRDRYEELKSEYGDPDKPIPLSPEREQEFEKLTKVSETPWYAKQVHAQNKHLKRENFVLKWSGKAFRMLLNKPGAFLRSISSPSLWQQKLEQHAVVRYYNQIAETPDLDKPYVFVPLHLQPEASTCPRAGVYTNQELIVQMLAKYLPEDVLIYVKEHPNQGAFKGEQYRSKEFYDMLREIPSVRLIQKNVSSFALIEHCAAVAVGTGTAGIEALFREKPVIMFGHRFYQWATGVHRVKTSGDCKEAIAKVFAHRDMPTVRSSRLFLKAIEETAAETFVISIRGKHPKYSLEQQAEIMGAYMEEKIRAVMQKYNLS